VVYYTLAKMCFKFWRLGFICFYFKIGSLPKITFGFSIMKTKWLTLLGLCSLYIGHHAEHVNILKHKSSIL